MGDPGHRTLVERHLPGVAIDRLVAVEDGWDSLVLDVNDEWIVRVPRRPQVQETLAVEIALLPELAPALPVPIPRFEVVAREGPPALVAYRKLQGRPLDAPRAAHDAALASAVAAFLAALHSFSVPRVVALGVEPADGAGWLQTYAELRSWAESRAFPLLATDERRAAAALFDDFVARAARGFDVVLVHADLGPEHVLCEGSRVTGVIDWGDVRIGDPALDFAWLLHGVGATFASALLAAYDHHGGRTDSELRERARFYHRLAPWYELHYGLEFDQPKHVESGLRAVRARLPVGT